MPEPPEKGGFVSGFGIELAPKAYKFNADFRDQAGIVVGWRRYGWHGAVIRFEDVWPFSVNNEETSGWLSNMGNPWAKVAILSAHSPSIGGQ